MVAGGVESMSRAPFVMAKPESAYPRGNPEVFDTTIGWRFTNPRLAELHHPYSMGETAENVAKRHKVSRIEQDQFALQSQQRYADAARAGRFADEIVPVHIPQRKGEPIVVDADEHPRPDSTLEALARLRPAFDREGTVTAGNSSGINDGAAALVLADAEYAGSLGLKPLAFVGLSATAGVDPACMGLGPIPATRKVLERTGRTIGDIELIELNEAFAAQAIPCIRELGLDPQQVNVNGGAIALGHPLGCSGARLAVTLVHEMNRRDARAGLAALCVGVGQGVATLFER
jgi:acetyl-CoA acetyltransferase family protein